MARSRNTQRKAAIPSARRTTWLEWLGLSAPPRPARRIIACGPRVYRPTKRTVMGTESIRVYGWPSRGGVIILSGASRADFDYLGWDIHSLPRRRDPDQDAEDDHCKKLLLLGATWYDSERRYKLLADAATNNRSVRERFENKQLPAVTRKEGLWVRVGWPSTGGLWVVEWDDPVFEEIQDESAEDYGPGYSEKGGLVGLARDMDERCEIIERIGGKFFACLEDYDGHAFLKAWEEKTTGEVGSLVVTHFVEW
ncbi:hypothetical protein ASPCAL14028 [Aspergillus calidoustus]|uniref:Uncharacterized protein n=1 Tax=Aspergillus calidoustus TaxID=454130 RepID=A0A0U5CJ30_ASPCI|nr:hypothetical protein ASPCAL14028 [Aspergillus calidoustus]